MLERVKNILRLQFTASPYGAPEYARSTGAEPLSDPLHMIVQEPTFDHYKRAMPGITPDWCRRAFGIERQCAKLEKTDWGFVTPVWILMGLICVIGQVALAQWALGAFA